MKAGLKSLLGKQIFGVVALLVLALILTATILPQSQFAAMQLSDAKDKKEKEKKKSQSDDDDDDDDEKTSDRELIAAEAKQDVNNSKNKESESSSSKSASKSAAPSNSLTASANDPSGKLIELIHATVETAPVPNGGDAADDPAIWVNPADPALSTIIGSDKRGGLAVYDLTGKQLQYLKVGEINNVDLRPGFKLGGETVTLVTGGNRSNNGIVIFKVNPQTRLLEDVTARQITTLEVYGACMYRSAKSEKTYYFVTSKTGGVEQWELADNGSGKVDAKKVRSFKVGTVIEGCVADDELGHFYVSEEAVGIWKYGAEPDAGSTRTQVDKTGSGGHLAADVEGLTIVYGQNGTGYLMVSSQGNYSYVVYKREDKNEFVKTFRVAAGDAVDGTEETDGIDAIAVSLGPSFPHGVFVAQDGYNDKGNQNFKLVPLEKILGKGGARSDKTTGR